VTVNVRLVAPGSKASVQASVPLHELQFPLGELTLQSHPLKSLPESAVAWSTKTPPPPASGKLKEQIVVRSTVIP
jgi:hypothetical protein